jgi:hypothetical protein
MGIEALDKLERSGIAILDQRDGSGDRATVARKRPFSQIARLARSSLVQLFFSSSVTSED